MQRPVLTVMAAGMGSRYGGLKQIDPVDEYGNIIMDFSIYDAYRAGFRKVIFIIKKENEASFREAIGDRISRQMEVAYVFQELSNLPEGFLLPQGRKKPWGTGHAVMSCRGTIDGPFVVINADDYYGRQAFQMAYDFLAAQQEEDAQQEKAVCQFMMVGYLLKNTLTENGHVARGICQTDRQNHLLGVKEYTRIQRKDGQIVCTDEDGNIFRTLPEDSIVSMNMWGFTPAVLQELAQRFQTFLKENLPKNPLGCEYYLPFVVDELLQENLAQVQVLPSPDQWFGVTYKEDKANVMAAIRALKQKGQYPEKLWN